MRFISLCDGIGAAYEAWTPRGWTCVARSEIEAFPLAVTAARQPGPVELGDVTKITEDQIALLGPLDLIIFGSPCQDLSVAGKRKGLAGERSGLFFACMRIAHWARQHCGLRYALWENVPGAFSSHKGADFAAVVRTMAGCDDVDVPANGWGSEGCAVGDHGLVEWAVLDAQWFGLAQRRKRVFAILDFGDWTRRPPILLERQGLRGDTPPRRSSQKDTAPAAGPSVEGGSAGAGPALAFGGNDTRGPIDVATARNAHGGPHGRLDFESETFVAQAIGFTAQDYGQDAAVDLAPTMRSGTFTESHANGGVMPAIAFALRGRDEGAQPEVHGPGDAAGALRAASGGSTRDYVAFRHNAQVAQLPGIDRDTSISDSLTCSQQAAVATAYAVRRLTPTECEKLMGFRPGFTAITYRGKPAADGPMYKSLGNSIALPCLVHIAEQIEIASLF